MSRLAELGMLINHNTDTRGLGGKERGGITEEQLAYLGATFDRVRDARATPSILRASGIKIERMSAENLRIVAGNRQPWQTLAWRYRDMVPELRMALHFRANAISRVKFYIAEIIDDDDEPIPVSMRTDEDSEKAARITVSEELCRAAEEELGRLPLDAGYTFLGVWSENYDVAADCWLHGFTHPITGEETWKIRSVEAINVQGSQLTVKNELGQPRVINLETEELYRLWIPHPAYDHLGDSALNALQDVLEDICLIGREMRAVSRSRIMQNGILFVPSSMAEQRNVREDGEDPHERRQNWMANFTASMLAPISNEGDAGGVVPMVQTGTPEEIKAVRYERFEREDSPALLLKLEKSLGRLANSLDIPPEILTGMADVNHWTAWQIDNSTFRHHLEPSIRLMVDSLTASFLRAALAKQGFPPEEVKRLRIWYDAGQITENPNRRQDALDALDRILIGPKAGREALGFNDGDAPTAEEALQLIAAKNGIDQSTAAAILAWAAREDGAENLPPEIGEPAQQAQLPAARPRIAPAEGDDAAPGGTGAPSTAPDGIAASARPWPNVCPCGSYADAQGRCVSKPSVHEALMGWHPEPSPASGQNMAGFLGLDAKEWQAWLDAQGEQLTPHQAAIRAMDQVVYSVNDPDRDNLRAAALAKSQSAPSISQAGSYRVDETAARDLADIDATLREQILVAADKAAKEALRRAGSRLRSKATSPRLDAGLRARLQSVRVEHWAATLGPEQCLKLNADQRFLLAGAWESVSGKFRQWVGEGIGKVTRRVLRMLGVRADSVEGLAVARQMRAEMEARVDAAWAHLQDGLDAHLEQVMFGTGDGVDTPGEVPEFDIPPRLVRDALAEIGGDTQHEGTPVAGLGSGSTVRGTLGDRGAIHVGLEWRYGYLPRNTFPPHESLDGQRFLDWSDDVLATTPGYEWIGPSFYVGDHSGCLCSYMTVYALPQGGTPTTVFSPQDVDAGALNSLRSEFLQGDLFEPARQPLVADTEPVALEGHAALAAAPIDLNDPKLQVNGMVGIDSERDQVQQYKGVGYTPTNQYLREGSGEFLRKNIEKLDAAIAKSKLTADIVTYRGIKDPRAVMGDLIDDDLTDLEWVDDAYLSTSADLRIADRFAGQSSSPDGGMVVNIRAAKGAAMLRLSEFAPADAVLTDASPEAELLGGRGWRMRVVADHGKGPDGIRRVDVEVVSHARNAEDPWDR